MENILNSINGAIEKLSLTENNNRKINKEDIDTLRFKINKIILYLKEVEFFIEDDLKKNVQKTINDAFKLRQKIRKMYKDELTLSDLKQELDNFIFKMSDDIFVLKKIVRTKPIYNPEYQPEIDKDLFSKIGKLFTSKRKISVLDYYPSHRNYEFTENDGELLKKIIKKINANETYSVIITSYKNASELYNMGFDFVVKEGIERKKRNAFDLALCFFDKFEISQPFYVDLFPLTTSEYFMSGNFLKNNGYLILNIPRAILHRFESLFYSLYYKKFKYKIHDIYRTDDEFENLIFVIQNVSADKKTEKLFNLALFDHNRLKHINEIDNDEKTINLTSGEFVEPFIIPYVLDDLDLEKDFENAPSPFEEIEEIIKPVEKAVDLGRPVQEYKVGHLPHVATTEITNGLYDTHQYEEYIPTKIKYDHLFSAKIIKKDVVDKDYEDINGEKVLVVTDKKLNVIHMSILDNDGNEIVLLNTDN